MKSRAAKRVLKRSTYVQMYALKELSDDFQVTADPYKDREECARLAELGVLFFRDEHHAYAAMYSETHEVQEGCYFQFKLEKDGSVSQRLKWNQRCRIIWMDKMAVNRVMLEK